MPLLWIGGDGPREIPLWALQYLVVVLGVDPDRLNRLKCVEQLDYIQAEPVHLIRIFDPEAGEKVDIIDFASLDPFPERILYEGYKYLEKEIIKIMPGRGTG